MELFTTKRKISCLEQCINVQKDIRSRKTSSMQHGRNRLEEASLILNNELLEDIQNDNIGCMQLEQV